MRMKRDEKCIVPYCDVAEESGAKPIYINVTIDGKRTWKKVGALCEVHLPDLDTGDSTSAMMHWLMYTPTDAFDFVHTLQKARLPFLRQALERLEDELRRGFPHKTRIKKVAARIRALEKELLKKDMVKRVDEERPERRGQEIVDQVLPPVEETILEMKKRKDVELSVADWRHVHELGKEVLPRLVLTSGSEIEWKGEKVHCDECGCDNVPDKDKDGNLFCGACEALIEVVK